MRSFAPSSLHSHAHNALLVFLSAQLKSGEALPAQRELARHCGASRTIIHRLLQLMVRSGLLKKGKSGLLLARRPRNQDYLPQPSVLSRREEVEQSLVDMLVRGKFKPGEYFSELALARQHGVTTGTVREALLRLSRLGVFVKQARKQWQVITISPDMIHELMDLRILLEMFAMNRLMAQAKDHPLRQALDRIHQETKSLAGPAKADHGEFFRLDRELHETILKSASNRYLREYSRHISFPIQLQFLHQAFDQSLLRLGLSHHLLILEAVARNDKKAACARLLEHLECARQTLLGFQSP